MVISVMNFQVGDKLRKQFEDKLSNVDGYYSELFRQFMREIVKMDEEKIIKKIERARLNDAKEKVADLEAKREKATA